ncbi:DUF6318 family protein [Paenarthrobacter sp. NPDC089714]|uniref:DUF6318 family protein n=1 Tax=Paenarthrobacter sp. NPDC089714 TaxID=3364377 RepID=UPI003806C634
MFRRSFALIPHAHFRSVAVGALALVLLSGCQGGSTPPETSTTTATPTSSASEAGTRTPPPTSSGPYKPADATGKAQNVPVPVMPALAKENTKEGLEAFIRYWYAVGNYANETGDILELRSLSTPECQPCAYFQRASSDGYTNGRWLVGGRVHLPSVNVIWNVEDEEHQATVQVVQDAVSYYNADGSPGRLSDPPSNDAFVIVASFQSGWKVVDTGVIR